MNTQLEYPSAPSRAERDALDEALFCTERTFDPAELPVYLPPVPEVYAARHEAAPYAATDARRDDFADADYPLPPYPAAREPTPDPCGLSDGGVSYGLTNLAPGVYEVRPTPPVTVECQSEEPPGPVPRDLRVEANTGLEVGPGGEACVGPDVVRVVGESPRLIELMLLSPPMSGALSRDGFALTGGDLFTQEDVDAGRIRYRHGGDAAPRGDSFSFATPRGEIPPTPVEIRVVVPRRAPRLRGAGPLDGIAVGVAAPAILAGRVEAPGECGLAVVGIGGVGEWVFSLDEGLSWRPVGEIRPSRALLLGPADRLRFTAGEGGATARLTYRAWDRSSHGPGDRVDLDPRGAVGGASAFSEEVATSTLRIRPAVSLARRPPADPWSAALTGTHLIGGALAVVRLAGPGAWQYSVGGAAWRECRAVYHGRALLLEADDRLRFVPHGGATGPVSLTFRSWDGGGPRGGRARLSTRASVGGETPFGGAIHSADWYLDPLPPESPEEPGVEGER